ncbi:MAG: hypothetical protein JXA83_10245 [Acidimicrobiales bacterium]|nr:hypothetical protein [Acidimicrobiales bacterium]
MTMQIDRRALVVGGGVAGLLSARVLADRYGEVIVVDRDHLPDDDSTPRRGVAQGRHAHALLARGQQMLDGLFPGLTETLVERGALRGDVLDDTRMYLGGHRLLPSRSGLVAVSASRALIEGCLRARVRALPGVQLRDRCDVVGLTASPDGRRITGARLLRRDGDSAEEVLEAGTVVDASGRSSRAAVWLGGLGVDGPEEDRVPIDVAYATRRYRLGPAALGGDLAVINAPTPRHPRAGVLAMVEGGEAMVTLAGILGDRPPTDPPGFVAFAESLQFPDIAAAIVDAEPVDDPVPYRFPAAVRRRYDRVRGLPDGFAVTGDSLCSSNPIYGQGMSVAALGARELQRHLDRYGRLRTDRFHQSLAQKLGPPWQLATGADLAFPGVGDPGTAQRLVGRYVSRAHAAAAQDPAVARAVVRVSGLVDGPASLVRPSMVVRVLGRRSRPSPASRSGVEVSGTGRSPAGA